MTHDTSLPESNSLIPSTTIGLSYQPYYERIIHQQLEGEQWGGLKLVVGPTGMGKTSAIPHVIKQLRAEGVDKRCIYTSHRHLLIQEMADELKKNFVPFVYLKSNADVVEAFLNWPNKGYFLNDLEARNFFSYANTKRAIVEKILVQLENDQSILKKLKEQFPQLYREQKESFAKKCHDFLKIFSDGLVNPDLPDTLHQELVLMPNMWQLFPYLAFLYDSNRPVLLVTVHKLLSGFFNGRTNERILSLANNIIFLDEFDMQEKELLAFLCQSPEIQNSFEFIRLFYEEMRRQQALGYLEPISADTETFRKSKRRIIEIMDKLDQRCRNEGYRFPALRHFSLEPSEFKSEALSVFQSGVQIVTTPFYLREQTHTWQIVKEQAAGTQRARPLMNIITRTITDILNFFSELWADELTPQWDNWIEQCYNHKNDNEPGRYKQIINEYGIYRRPKRLATEKSDSLIEETIYYKGFDFFRLERGIYHTTPNEVRLSQKKLAITPEYLLWRLTESNLVFALSATGDIKRYVNSFDMNWFEQYGHYLPIEQSDKELVQTLKQAKESKRNYNVRVEAVGGLPPKHPLTRVLKQLEQERFFQRDTIEEFHEIAVEHRRETLSLTLETIRWIITESENQSHLVFLNSFVYVERFLQQDAIYDFTNLKDEFTVDFLPNSSPRTYRVTLADHSCQVVFLDASTGRDMVEDRAFYQQESDVPLVLITTYPTASNGINLRWLPFGGKNKKTDGHDFESIHLLEAPHYYFSNQTADSPIDTTKIFIWQVWKLYYNHQISESQLYTALQNTTQTNQISRFNLYYKGTTDFLLNQIALFHQALGRLDRQWQIVPTTEIRLAAVSRQDSVYAIFERYLTAQGAIAENRLQREPYTSTLILKLYEQLEKKLIRRAILNELQSEDLAPIQERAKQQMEILLKASNGVRQGQYTLEDAKKIMRLWWQIREAVLKQDYYFQVKLTVTNQKTKQTQNLEIDFQRDFVHETGLLIEGHKLWIDWSNQKVHREPTATTTLYDLNRAYLSFATNDMIVWYFRNHNYRLIYNPAIQQAFFIPHVQQAILAGAVGEAALRAVLEHYQVTLVPERDCPPELFEIADMQILGVPIYLDAKNFSQLTLQHFSIQPDDPAYDDKLNSEVFLRKARDKWHYLFDYTQDSNTKLVFINLVADNNRPNEGWDAQLNPIEPYDWSRSAITVIQGVISRQKSDSIFRPDFLVWLNQIKEQLSSNKEQ